MAGVLSGTSQPYGVLSGGGVAPTFGGILSGAYDIPIAPAQWRMMQEAMMATPDRMGAINDAGAGVGYGLAHSLNFTAPDNNPQTGNWLVDSAPIAFGLLGGIKAYHGSPHDFDQFSMQHIGSGEGAQVYGHGLYFAENPDVAYSYGKGVADRHLKDWEVTTGGKVPSWIGTALQNYKTGSPEWHSLVDQYRADFENRLKESQAELATSHQPWNVEWKIAAQQATLDALNNLKSGGLKKRGITYEVDLNAHPDEFLDWDKPLSEQSPKVQEALKAVAPQTEQFGPGYSPRHLGLLKTPEGAEALRSAGIKGIRYADQGSRGNPGAAAALDAQIADTQGAVDTLQAGLAKMRGTRGEAGQAADLKQRQDELAALKAQRGRIPKSTSNYVVFDDKTINILRKYGLAGLTAGLGGAAAMSGASPDQGTTR